MKRFLARIVRSDQDMFVNRTRASALVAGQDILATSSPATIQVAGGDVNMSASQARVIVAGHQVSARKSKIGLIFSDQVVLKEGSVVWITTPQAIGLGAALGVVFSIFTVWLTRRFPRR